MLRPLLRPAALVAAVGLVGVAVVEVAQWRSSRTGFPAGAARVPDPDVVLVLGCPSLPGARLHPMQQWRVDIGVRSLGTGRLVLTGGAPDGIPSEAAVMGRYARALGVPASRVVLEERSRNTWQNVAFAVPHLLDARSIAVASAPSHAARARRYLARQRPDLAARLVPADDYRPGERLDWKVATLAYGLARAVHRRLFPVA